VCVCVCVQHMGLVIVHGQCSCPAATIN